MLKNEEEILNNSLDDDVYLDVHSVKNPDTIIFVIVSPYQPAGKQKFLRFNGCYFASSTGGRYHSQDLQEDIPKLLILYQG